MLFSQFQGWYKWVVLTSSELKPDIFTRNARCVFQLSSHRELVYNYVLLQKRTYRFLFY